MSRNDDRERHMKAASEAGLLASYMTAKQKVREMQAKYEAVNAELKLGMPFARYQETLERKKRLKNRLLALLKEQEAVQEAVFRIRQESRPAPKAFHGNGTEPVKGLLEDALQALERFALQHPSTTSEKTLIQRLRHKLGVWDS